MTIQNAVAADIRPIAKILLAHPASARASVVLRDREVRDARAIEILVNGQIVDRVFEVDGDFFRATTDAQGWQWTARCSAKLRRRNLGQAQSRSLRSLSRMGIETRRTPLAAFGGADEIAWRLEQSFAADEVA
ncbi:hypothetical protein [Chenggangzhangella methanolivorans]|uniref:Uncharacterized protein n=1 Tax=Chenggangzhangella methanolivorans TaxID=1437009 RepID=A0A9E6UMY6_9HYPH|nr:hypothetical protein [Chenggangzhangella methanolivorans]QZN99643.1 hypothetical protein K6K41_23585 [Chenggangzhangella methanolivorans]